MNAAADNRRGRGHHAILHGILHGVLSALRILFDDDDDHFTFLGPGWSRAREQAGSDARFQSRYKQLTIAHRVCRLFSLKSRCSSDWNLDTRNDFSTADETGGGDVVVILDA